MANSDGSAEVLVVLCRAPVLGTCKTRLQAALGAQGALQAHIELATGTCERLAATGLRRVLYCTESNKLAEQWAQQYGFGFARQEGGDLGARMFSALAAELGDAGKVCLVGTDCPKIDAEYVARAFRALDRSDLVLGPAEDGGYGLIATTVSCPEIFQNVAWSSSSVLADTLAIAQRIELTSSLLPTIWDVDTPADWRRYQSQRQGSQTG